jgi:S1-C subfamily serine protease
MRAFAAATLALSVSLGSPAFAGISNADLNRQIDQTNFLVNGNCSGTLIDAKTGLILTANHCIMDQFQDVDVEEVQADGTIKKIRRRITKPGAVSQLKFAGGGEVERTTFVYKIKAHDQDHDLALIQVIAKLPNRMGAQLACKEPQRLDPVYAVGNPFAVLYSSASTGVIASVERDYRVLGIDGDGDDPLTPPGSNALIQSTAAIAGGNSGGALYNADGELIGVNVRGSQTMSPMAFSVPLDDIRKFLKDNGVDLTDCH